MNYTTNPKEGKSEALSKITQDFAKTLKNVRVEKSYTQHDLSERSGLSLRMISDLERGIRQPSLITLYKLAKGLGIPLLQLIEKFLKERGQSNNNNSGLKWSVWLSWRFRQENLIHEVRFVRLYNGLNKRRFFYCFNLCSSEGRGSGIKRKRWWGQNPQSELKKSQPVNYTFNV